MFGIVSSVDGPEIITDIVISLAGYTISRWPDWYGDRLFFQIRVRKDSVHINHCPSSEKYANCIHRHRALPTITRIDQWWSGGYRHTDQNNGSLCVYFIDQILPFIEITQSKQIVLSDTQQPPVSRNLLNRCSVILHTMMQQCGQNAYGTRKCNIYAQSAMSTTPDEWYIMGAIKFLTCTCTLL